MDSILLALCNARRDRDFLAICKLALTQDGQPPEWVELVPAGKVTALDGRKFQNTKPDEVVKRFNEVSLDVPIDWEHASEIKAPQGDEAPAAGWISALEIRGGSIWGQVEWTPRGAVSLSSKEYRYISPAFTYSKSGEVLEIVSAGLTNKPALEELAAVAHVTPNNRPNSGEDMDPQVLAALGLAATATNAEVLAAIQSLRSDGQKMASDLIDVRGELTTTQEELAIAQKQEPPLDKFVPRADHDALKARAETAETALASQAQETKDNEIAAEIASALKAGKITPATSDYHKAQCSQEGGLERFREYVKTAPIIGDPSDLENNGNPQDNKNKKATAEQLAIASRMGVSEKEFLAAL